MARIKTFKTNTPGIRKDIKGRHWVNARIHGKTIWKLVGNKRTAIALLAKPREESRRAKLFPEELARMRLGTLRLSQLFRKYRTEDELHNKASDRNWSYERRWLKDFGDPMIGSINIPRITQD